MVLVSLRSLLTTLPGRLLFYLAPLSIMNWRLNGYHLRQDREFVNAKDVLVALFATSQTRNLSLLSSNFVSKATEGKDHPRNLSIKITQFNWFSY